MQRGMAVGDEMKAGTAGRRLEAVRIRMLGGFRVSVGSRTIEEDDWRLRKAAGLVKLLALAPRHRLHREQAMDRLWPDSEAKAAANNLHHVLHVARRALGPVPGYLSLRDGRLSLCREGWLWIDVEAFEEAAASARRAREPAAYRAALDLYVGDLLPDDPYEDWAEERRESLRSLRLALLMELAGLHEERGERGPAAEALGRVISAEPAREEAHAGLMRLWAAGGERGRALDQYERLREALSRESDTEPSPKVRSLREEISSGRVPAANPVPGRPVDAGTPDIRHNLPARRTSFVGRERELLEVKRELAMTRMLTLTGAGGSGKTRLALETARDLAGAYPDGAWLVELAPLSQPSLMPQAVASVLGVREQADRPLEGTLAEALRARTLLLLLDNCEHLVDAAARLADLLLDACPKVRLLATSREALGVAGEVNWPVPPLPLPDPEKTPTAAEIEGYGSARLFVERALYRPSAFVLTEENARAVADICRRLDGIPLAIELAAARVGAMAVEQVSERLSDSLGLLTGGGRTATARQQTLRGSLDWSYDLLDDRERDLFARLSAFAGGWTLEAAEALEPAHAREGEVLDGISRLVDKSLVLAGPSSGGAVRYGMLEPLRQYAREKLEEGGKAEAVRRRHATFFVALAEEAEPMLEEGDQAAWVERLGREHPNLRAALSWSLEAEPEMCLRLAGAVWRFWQMRGHLGEGRRWLDEALERGGGGIMRARALRAAGALAWTQGDYRSAEPAFEESLALSREAGDGWTAARALNGLGSVARDLGDHARARTFLEESLVLWRGLENSEGVAQALQNLGGVAFYQGDHARAMGYWEESLAIYREIGEKHASAISLNNLGEVARIRGEHDRAAELGLKSLALFREIDDRWAIFQSMISLGRLELAREDYDRAARLFASAQTLRETIGAALSPAENSDYERNVADARSALGETTFATSWEAGSSLGQELAVEYALSGMTGAPATSGHPTPAGPPDGLTRREEEVAVLAARGLTNRRIGQELSISEHTAATHVRRILRKLGLASRYQLAARAAERRWSPETDRTSR